MNKLKIHLIAAARPNFMKVAPLFHELSRSEWCHPILVHTGQHYDFNMSGAFFRDLALPDPNFHLEVGSGSHAEQTGNVMIAYEHLCRKNRPDLIVVVGDVNSTAACAMVGAKLWIPVVHLEAGLRSNDRQMPEEINRLVTDAIANVLWTPSPDADQNLLDEGVSPDQITMIGNIMIDSFEMLRSKIERATSVSDAGLSNDEYILATLHRPSNVDSRDNLEPIISALEIASNSLPVVFVAHPRTRKSLQKFELIDRLESNPAIRLLNPLPYVDFMSLMASSRCVITDSGGLQEETTYLGIPCLTMRDNTERPITVDQGTNRLVNATDLFSSLKLAINGDWTEGQVPKFWDGRTAARAVEDLRTRFFVGN